MDKLERLHELCRKEEVRQQKLIGLLACVFAIGLQVFSGSIFFAVIPAIVCGSGCWLILNDELLEGGETDDAL